MDGVYNMATLSFSQKKYFEKVLEMEGGYVLDFTNRTFQEFIFDSMQIDIYQKFEYESKARLLRRVISEFNDVKAGKLLMELLDYKRLHLKISTDEQETFRKCIEIANNLMGKSVKKETSATAEKDPGITFDFSSSLSDLITLSKITNNQKRGYDFEKYLYKLFNDNQLAPRKSFKLKGEQIDGSFSLNNEIYLLEAKWTKKTIDKGELVKFNEKVLSKSSFTRGFFISFSGFTDEALATFNTGRSVSIILMTVQELAIMLEREISFKKMLNLKVRALAEKGEFYKPLTEIL